MRRRQHKISAEEVGEMMASQEVAVESSTREEYDGGHIENAVLSPRHRAKMPPRGASTVVAMAAGLIAAAGRQQGCRPCVAGAWYQRLHDFWRVTDWPMSCEGGIIVDSSFNLPSTRWSA